MMMERLRWLVAVLVAFVLGWVGHAVYGGPDAPLPASLTAVVAGDAAPTVSEAALPTPVAVASPAAAIGAAPEATAGATVKSRDPFVTPGAVDALMAAVEESNRQWLAAFEAEDINPAWAAQAEDELRRGFSAELPFGQARIESILCKASKCRLIVVNEREETNREPHLAQQAATRAWPSFRAGSTSYQPLPDGQAGYRATVFLEARPAVPPPP